jgi:4-hydroxy-2-oxoheptanedioate aldolase
MATIRETTEARASFGAWVTLSDTVSAEVMGRAGFDWVILDTQHGAIGWPALTGVLQALDLGGTPALVRTGANDPAQIGRALDLGAVGVVVPMVSTASQARAAAEATRYPPLGVRSFGPVRSFYGAPDETRPEPLCLVMIETAEALGNLEAIAAVEGVDGLFLGPVDLALSLGLGAALTMPDPVLEAVDAVVAAASRHGLIAGCPSLGLENGRALANRGVRFITVASDVGAIRRGAAADLAEARAWTQGRTS